MVVSTYRSVTKSLEKRLGKLDEVEVNQRKNGDHLDDSSRILRGVLETCEKLERKEIIRTVNRDMN